MRGYVVTGLGLLLGATATWAGNGDAAAPAPSGAIAQPGTTRAALNLDEAPNKLTEATGATWRIPKGERAPGLGAELWGEISSWHGVAVPYVVLPFGLDEQSKAKLELFRRNCNAALDVIASDDRCVVLAGPSRDPDVTARILAVLGMPESKEAEQLRKAHARPEWLDFRLAVARPSGTRGDLPIPLANGPTVAQIKDYQELFAAKGSNVGRYRGNPFLWFHRLGFCELSPLLVTTEDRIKAPYILLSNRPEHVLLSGSARPRPWHLKRVYAATDPQGRPSVGLEFDAAAAKLMGTLTESNIGRPLAVLFFDSVLSVLTIEGKITDKLLISGAKFDKALVDKIVRSLSECMLADNETVSPATMSAADGRGQWSQVVNGLQCRLMVDRGPGAEGQVLVDGVERKVKLLGGELLVLELRNAGKEPIYVPLWRDELPIVELSVSGCPGLRSPTTYGDAWAMPHLLAPGEVLRRQLSGNTGGNYIVAGGWNVPGKGPIRFDPAGLRYEISGILKWDQPAMSLTTDGKGEKVKVWTGSLTTNSVKIRMEARTAESEAREQKEPTSRPVSPLAQPGKWTITEDFPAAIFAEAQREDRSRSATPWNFEGVKPQVFSDGQGRYRIGWVKKDPLRDSYWYSWYEFDQTKLVGNGRTSIPSDLMVPDITQAPGWIEPRAKGSTTQPAPNGASTQPATQASAPVTAEAIAERVRALGSALYKEREQAQQWLIDLGDRAAAALREAAKGEGESAVRAKAALVEIGRRKLAKFFVGMPVRMPLGLPDDPGATGRLAWIEALGALSDLRTTGILLEYLEDNGAVHEAAAEALRKMSGQTFADDPNQWRTWWAEVQHPKEPAAALVGRLGDPRVEVRREAIWKLAMLRDPNTLDVLVERFVNRRGGEPRGPGIADEKMHWSDLPHLRTALVCMGPAASGRLVRISGYGWRICESAFAAALQIGGQAVINEAVRQVQGDDPYGRKGGAKVLTELRPLSGILPLMRALDNNRFQDAEVDRALAAYDSRAVPYLRKAWEDKTLGKSTRLAAAILLVHHGDDVGMSALADTVANGEKLLMNATVGRMYYTRDPRMLPLIAKALERKDAQQMVAYAAAACGGKDAIPMLRKALTHPDVGVRYGAQVWVEKLSKAPEASSEEDAERWKSP